MELRHHPAIVDERLHRLPHAVVRTHVPARPAQQRLRRGQRVRQQLHPVRVSAVGGHARPEAPLVDQGGVAGGAPRTAREEQQEQGQHEHGVDC